MLSREQEIAVLEDEVRQLDRRLQSLERAPYEGRWCGGKTEHQDAVAALRNRLLRTEVSLGELRLLGALEEELA